MKQQIRSLQKEDLDYLLSWRNDKKIRSHMIQSNKITKKEHYNWYNNCLIDKNKLLFVYEEDNRPCGFVQFDKNENDKTAEWGFYKKPDAQNGVGFRMGLCAIDTIKNMENINKIVGKVLVSNNASINFHKKLGFKVNKTESNINIICFEILLI